MRNLQGLLRVGLLRRRDVPGGRAHPRRGDRRVRAALQHATPQRPGAADPQHLCRRQDPGGDARRDRERPGPALAHHRRAHGRAARPGCADVPARPVRQHRRARDDRDAVLLLQQRPRRQAPHVPRQAHPGRRHVHLPDRPGDHRRRHHLHRAERQLLPARHSPTGSPGSRRDGPRADAVDAAHDARRGLGAARPPRLRLEHRRRRRRARHTGRPRTGRAEPDLGALRLRRRQHRRPPGLRDEPHPTRAPPRRRSRGLPLRTAADGRGRPHPLHGCRRRPHRFLLREVRAVRHSRGGRPCHAPRAGARRGAGAP